MVLKLVYIITLMIWCIYPLTCAQNHQNQTITSAQNQSETIIAKAGCDSECGNVSIPFPFGMHDTKCFASEWFEIDCRNTASQGEKPYLRLIDLEVIFIDLSGKVWIMNPIIKYCQENFRYLNMMRTVKQLGGGPFVYSKDDNSLVAVGCQNSAYLFSNDSIVSGCVTMCDDDQKQGLSSDVASCRGTYCCETSLSSSLSEYTVRIGTLGLVNMKPLFEGCSYALIRADYKRFPNKFSKRKWVPTIGDLEKNLTEIPAVLEWEILNDTLNNPFPANQYGRYCYPTSVTSPPQSKYTHSGWRCRCQHQHSEGNPYIEGSCKAKPFDPPEPPIIKKKNGAKWAIIGVSSSLGTIILFLGLWWLHKVVREMIAKKRKEKFFKQNGGLLLEQRLYSGEVNVDKIKLFNLKDLEKATDHFNINRVLGKGGQGTVYKGMLVDGKIVAVKKFKVKGNIEEFINEFVILSQINHRNVVKLLGCCLETEIPLLVYEFIPNGNLSEYLHGQNEDLPMTWDMRWRIATEVAGALFYLHSVASQPIYHRDVKPTNILLDEKYRAKVADFGASRMVSIEATHLTTAVQGTFGYLDPEYFHTGQLTEKSDVYSFGVVLVELLTGQKPISSVKEQELKSLASYFVLCVEENRLFDIIDERIMKEGEKEHIIVVAKLARRCLLLNGKKRPTMKEVTLELESIQKREKQSDAQEHHEELEFAGIEDSQFWAAYSTTSNSGQTSDSKALTLEIMPILIK